jgi:hypothetical protein
MMGLPYVPFRIFFVEGFIDGEGEAFGEDGAESELDLVPM